MSKKIEQFIRHEINLDSLTELETVQSLWSGYGKIIRYRVTGFSNDTLIVKWVTPPSASDHPKGWNTDLSHQRKVLSYQIELNWYQSWVGKLTRQNSRAAWQQHRVPQCFGQLIDGEFMVLLLEDLDAAGYNQRWHSLSTTQIKACLSWLACFHAHFLEVPPSGLWPMGTYWHIETRPDEFEVMPEGPLKQHAHTIDQKLSNARYQTIVHGDAKVANFCFHHRDNRVAAVDFQYIGGGCGMKDVAYFLSSIADESQCFQLESDVLTYYFEQLKIALNMFDKSVDFDALKQEWSHLYAYAWADFYRFLQGWSPAHKKNHGYSRAKVEQVIADLS